MTTPTEHSARPRPYSQALARLQAAGLRPTRQRMGLARILLEGTDRHVTAEQVHAEAAATGLRVSLATVYNTLHQFTECGLLREVVVEAGRSYFDTNTDAHHHFFYEDRGELVDIPSSAMPLPKLPATPDGAEIKSVEVIIRLARR